MRWRKLFFTHYDLIKKALFALTLFLVVSSAQAELGDEMYSTSLNGVVPGDGQMTGGVTIRPAVPEGDVELLIIARALSEGFDPVLRFIDFTSGAVIAENDTWTIPLGGQTQVQDPLRCYVENIVGELGANDAVLLVFGSTDNPLGTSALAEVSSGNGQTGDVVLSFLQVDSVTLSELIDCGEIGATEQ